MRVFPPVARALIGAAVCVLAVAIYVLAVHAPSVPEADVAGASKPSSDPVRSLDAVVDKCREAKGAVAQWIEEQGRWEREVVPLTTNDEGRRLGSKEEVAMEFAGLVESLPATRETAEQREAALDKVLEQLRQARASRQSESPVSDQTLADIDAWNAEADQAVERYRAAQQRVRGMLASVAGEKPSDWPLEVVIEQIRAKRAVDEEARNAEEARRQRIAQEEIERAERKALADGAVSFANDPGNKLLLAPFFAKATTTYTMHGASGNMGCQGTGCRRFEVPMPASFQEMVKSGILDDDDAFLRALMKVRGPNGLFPQYCCSDRPSLAFSIPDDVWRKSFRDMSPGIETKATDSQANALKTMFEQSTIAGLQYLADDDHSKLEESVHNAWEALFDAVADGERLFELRKSLRDKVEMRKRVDAAIGMANALRSEWPKFRANLRKYGPSLVDQGLLSP